jgi:cytochrome c biogenesis protein CcmG/thiol:disulfide interchange protein DsbE
MKNKILFSLAVLFFAFCFVVLLKGLKNSNIYIPNALSKKTLVSFKSEDLYSGITILSDKIFVGSEYYVLNIWASWCLPCRDEHSILMKLKNNLSIKLIGLNYKDDPNNAKKFIDEFGNPYSMIITDKNGTIAIELGAYGVPETFVLNKNKKILKKFIGPLNQKSLKEIKLILK